MIISILGKAGKDKSTGKFFTSTYEVDESLSNLIASGNYYNATHALVENNPDEAFVFFYTKGAFDYQKEWLPAHSKQYRYIEIKEVSPEAIFDQFYDTIASSNEKIFFDITHSYRDLVIMSVIATIVNRFMHQYEIELVYARQVEGSYRFVKEESLIDISEWTYLLTTFKSTLNIPADVSVKDDFGIFDALQRFSQDLMGNRIGSLLNESFPALYAKLKTAKISVLKPLKELMTTVVEEIAVLDTIRNETKEFKKHYLFARKMYEKHYHLIALTYLYEAIPYYLHERLKQDGFFQDRSLDYNFAGELKKLLKDKGKISLYGVIVEISGDIRPLSELYESIRERRNNLAHLNADYAYGRTDLGSLLDDFKRIVIEEDILNKTQIRVSHDEWSEIFKEIGLFWEKLGLNRNPKIIEELYRQILKNEKDRVFKFTPKKLRNPRLLRSGFRRIIELQYMFLIQKEKLGDEKKGELIHLMKIYDNESFITS